MKNKNGFTLIELLAVITIMGILMMVAIPTISRTIENSRKDTFIDIVNQYAKSVQNMWFSDNFQCDDYSSSAVQTGTYYVQIDSSNPSLDYILEQGGKSPWGNREIKGMIVVTVLSKGTKRDIKFYPVLLDGIHGVNVEYEGRLKISRSAGNIVRGDLVMSGADYSIVLRENGVYKTWQLTVDLNGDGDKDDVVDGIPERSGDTILCVAR